MLLGATRLKAQDWDQDHTKGVKESLAYRLPSPLILRAKRSLISRFALLGTHLDGRKVTGVPSPQYGEGHQGRTKTWSCGSSEADLESGVVIIEESTHSERRFRLDLLEKRVRMILHQL